ncbi:MAG: sugar porter family MFS transporter [Alteromonadaceae bacterium]|nr:sugar porter family MFS transporter [Alteromonadaceae bacterium]
MYRSNLYNVFVAIVVALGGFIFGFDASVISGVVGFVSTEFQLSELQQGFVVASPTLGAVFGTFVAGPLADILGRKKVIIIVAGLYVISAALSALAVTYEMLVVARMVGGLAFASLVLAPMYIAEISPAKLRGKMISINQFNIVIGISAAYFTNYYLLQLSQSSSEFIASIGLADNVWRWMLGLELVPAILFFALLFIIPESPRWLITSGKTEKGIKVLNRLFPGQNAQHLVSEIQAQSDTNLPLKSRVSELFSGKVRLILVVGVIVGISQQITGVNAIYFYAPTIFEQSGIGQNAAFSQAIWVGLVNVLFTIVAMLLIDRLGRRPLMLIGLAGVAVSMSIAAYGFSQATYRLTQDSIVELNNPQLQQSLAPILNKTFESDVEFKNSVIDLIGLQKAQQHQSTLIQASVQMNPVIILVGILGFVASFAVSLGPVMWVLLAEIFPNHLRGVGIALTGLINSAVSFSVQQFFPLQLAMLGTATTFMIYGGFAILGFILLYRLLPETKGLNLEQLSEAFESQSKKLN